MLLRTRAPRISISWLWRGQISARLPDGPRRVTRHQHVVCRWGWLACLRRHHRLPLAPVEEGELLDVRANLRDIAEERDDVCPGDKRTALSCRPTSVCRPNEKAVRIPMQKAAEQA